MINTVEIVNKIIERDLHPQKGDVMMTRTELMNTVAKRVEQAAISDELTFLQNIFNFIGIFEKDETMRTKLDEIEDRILKRMLLLEYK